MLSLADPGGPLGPGPPLPLRFLQNNAILRGKPLFWVNFRLRPPLGSKLRWAPLSKILDPRLFVVCANYRKKPPFMREIQFSIFLQQNSSFKKMFLTLQVWVIFQEGMQRVIRIRCFSSDCTQHHQNCTADQTTHCDWLLRFACPERCFLRSLLSSDSSLAKTPQFIDFSGRLFAFQGMFIPRRYSQFYGRNDHCSLADQTVILLLETVDGLFCQGPLNWVRTPFCGTSQFLTVDSFLIETGFFRNHLGVGAESAVILRIFVFRS